MEKIASLVLVLVLSVGCGGAPFTEADPTQGDDAGLRVSVDSPSADPDAGAAVGDDGDAARAVATPPDAGAGDVDASGADRVSVDSDEASAHDASDVPSETSVDSASSSSSSGSSGGGSSSGGSGGSSSGGYVLLCCLVGGGSLFPCGAGSTAAVCGPDVGSTCTTDTAGTRGVVEACP
jgi:hypothetical protein